MQLHPHALVCCMPRPSVLKRPHSTRRAPTGSTTGSTTGITTSSPTGKQDMNAQWCRYNFQRHTDRLSQMQPSSGQTSTTAGTPRTVHPQLLICSSQWTARHKSTALDVQQRPEEHTGNPAKSSPAHSLKRYSTDLPSGHLLQVPLTTILQQHVHNSCRDRTLACFCLTHTAGKYSNIITSLSTCAIQHKHAFCTPHLKDMAEGPHLQRCPGTLKPGT